MLIKSRKLSTKKSTTSQSLAQLGARAAAPRVADELVTSRVRLLLMPSLSLVRLKISQQAHTVSLVAASTTLRPRKTSHSLLKLRNSRSLSRRQLKLLQLLKRPKSKKVIATTDVMSEATLRRMSTPPIRRRTLRCRLSQLPRRSPVVMQVARAMLMSLLRIISRPASRNHGLKMRMSSYMREVKPSVKLLSNERNVTSQDVVEGTTKEVVWEDVPPNTRLITTHPCVVPTSPKASRTTT